MNVSHVYLIDNDRSRRAVVAAALAEHGFGYESFDDVPGFLNHIDYERLPASTCVLSYLNLAPVTGLELLDIFRADRIALPTVLVAGTKELSQAVKAMRYGTCCILWRPFSAAHLAEVLKNVLREWADDPIALPSAEPVERSPDASLEGRFSSLSRRQRQVLRYVFEGNGNRAIAAALGISIKTVELHRSCAMKKMQADSVIALVKMLGDFRHALEQST